MEQHLSQSNGWLQPLLLVATGGALGSVLRYSISRWLGGYGVESMWCTLSINIFGSLLLGITASCVGKAEPAYLLLGVGLCGGFTTFSTISMEFTALLLDKRYGLTVLYGVGSMCGGVAAFTLGHWFFEWVFAAKPS